MEKNSFWNKNCFGNASCQHASRQDSQSLAVGTFDKKFYHMFQKVGANNKYSGQLPVQNVFEAYNKDTRTTSTTSFFYFYC